jgi:protein phosphatase
VNSAFSYLASADVTDVGRRRKNNEDSVLRLPEAGVFCVADGMGGVQGGEVASKAAVDALREMVTASPDAPCAVTALAAARLVARALNRASQWIKARSEERGLTGTGSTAVVLAFDRVTPAQAVILHAGDSRAYRFRGERLEQLSTDHSVAAAAGLPDDKNLPAMFRGVITRAVGLEGSVVLEETPADVAGGDLFLLCSDGLTKMVSDKALGKLLRKHRDEDVAALAGRLVGEALEAGGEDNVSVVLVRVSDVLPEGPIMEVPPRTRELEREPLSPETPRSGEAQEDAEKETGQTACTGQTVDTAGFERAGVTPPEFAQATPAPGAAVTPPPPFSGEGVTPVLPGAAAATAAVFGAPARVTPPRRRPRRKRLKRGPPRRIDRSVRGRPLGFGFSWRWRRRVRRVPSGSSG